MSEFKKAFENSGTGLLIKGTIINFIEYWNVLIYLGLVYMVGRKFQDPRVGVFIIFTSWIMISAWCRQVRINERFAESLERNK